MGIAARDAYVLELLVGHFQQGQPAAPALQQSAEPLRERAQHMHQPADEAAPARRAEPLPVQSSIGVTDCLDCSHCLSAKIQNCTLFGAWLICIDSQSGAI